MKDDGVTSSNVFADEEKEFEDDVWISTSEVEFELVFKFGVEIVSSKGASLGEIVIEPFENVVEFGGTE